MIIDNKKRFRIVNKSQKGIILVTNGQTLELTWDAFKEQFIQVDKFYATLKPEYVEKMNKVDDLVNQALVCVMFQNGQGSTIDKMSHLAALADITKEISKLLGCTSFEAATLIKQRMDLFKNDPLGVALGVAPSRKSYDNKKKEESKPTPVYAEKKPTLGDAFACLGELKDQMES